MITDRTLRRAALALVFLACGCSSTTPTSSDGVSGYFAADGVTSVHLFLYDDVDGTSSPEMFFLKTGEPATIATYSWGTYTERGDSLLLRFTTDAQPDSITKRYPYDAHVNGAARWQGRPKVFTASIYPWGAVTFRRIADEPPEGARGP